MLSFQIIYYAKIVHKETMKGLCSSLCWGARNSNTIVKMLSFQVTYYAKIVHKEIVQRLCTRRLCRIFLPETVGPAVFGTFPVAGLII